MSFSVFEVLITSTGVFRLIRNRLCSRRVYFVDTGYILFFPQRLIGLSIHWQCNKYDVIQSHICMRMVANFCCHLLAIASRGTHTRLHRKNKFCIMLSGLVSVRNDKCWISTFLKVWVLMALMWLELKF